MNDVMRMEVLQAQKDLPRVALYQWFTETSKLGKDHSY